MVAVKWCSLFSVGSVGSMGYISGKFRFFGGSMLFVIFIRLFCGGIVDVVFGCVGLEFIFLGFCVCCYSFFFIKWIF